jgi:hypothetical protein
MERVTTAAYVHLNARLMPLVRGERFEDPLAEALEANGEIDHCGIDVDLHDVEQGARFICRFLTDIGAPRGSKLSYEQNGQTIELPFGSEEGLAIYLNGTDLPAEVYQQSDINVVVETIARLLAGRAEIKGYWQGPTETALYIYGKSAQEMRDLIAGFIAEYPLCQRARLDTIA